MKVILNVPNLITIARIVLIPVFITAVVYKKYEYALYLFLFAALTDKLDGVIAKARNQKTEFGGFLDPLADKFMLVASFVLLAIYGFVPKWLTIVVISRDAIVVTGWTILFLTMHVSKVEPLLTGKLAIAMQFSLICLILVEINYGLFKEFHGPIMWATAILTVFSGLHYIYRGLKKAQVEEK